MQLHPCLKLLCHASNTSHHYFTTLIRVLYYSNIVLHVLYNFIHISRPLLVQYQSSFLVTLSEAFPRSLFFSINTLKANHASMILILGREPSCCSQTLTSVLSLASIPLPIVSLCCGSSTWFLYCPHNSAHCLFYFFKNLLHWHRPGCWEVLHLAPSRISPSSSHPTCGT